MYPNANGGATRVRRCGRTRAATTPKGWTRHASATRSHQESHLVELLYTAFAWGIIPTTVVQRIATAAEQDWLDASLIPPTKLATLAEMGMRGMYTGNAGKTLLSVLRPVIGLPAALLIRIPFIKHKGVTTTAPGRMDSPVLMMN